MVSKKRNKNAVVIEGSQAVARAVKSCDVKVIAAYPITPQTHIVQELAKMHANGEIDCEYINVEAEFSAISAVLGSTAAGVRSFTATSSQGLALMNEVLYATAGMRIPVVMVVCNRALSAPINIWNDHQDSIAERDSGWIQIYVESVQEAVDSLIQAYKISEDKKVLLPSMVCMDGFYLTHVYEPVVIPEKEEVDKFLPAFEYPYPLDPEKPLTMGPLGFPNDYARLRKQLFEATLESKGKIVKANKDFKKCFGRSYGDGLIEVYGDGKIAIVSMGSLCSTIKEYVDSSKDVCLVRIRTFRPFPGEELKKVLKDKEKVIVMEKNISLGHVGSVFMELATALYGTGIEIYDFIVGSGGIDVPLSTINYVVERVKKNKEKPGSVVFIDKVI